MHLRRSHVVELISFSDLRCLTSNNYSSAACVESPNMNTPARDNKTSICSLTYTNTARLSLVRWCWLIDAIDDLGPHGLSSNILHRKDSDNCIVHETNEFLIRGLVSVCADNVILADSWKTPWPVDLKTMMRYRRFDLATSLLTLPIMEP